MFTMFFFTENDQEIKSMFLFFWTPLPLENGRAKKIAMMEN